MIDLSHNNDPLSFHALEAAGVIALANKASQGANLRDPSFTLNMARANEVGWIRLAYHFATNEDPAAQLANYEEMVSGIGDFYPAIDFEVDPAGHTCDAGTLLELNAKFVSVFGRHPFIYGPQSFLKPVMSRLPLNPMWPADLEGMPDYIPAAQLMLVQFSWDGDPGIVPRGVDVSRWVFPNAEFADWYGSKKIGYPVTRPVEPPAQA